MNNRVRIRRPHQPAPFPSDFTTLHQARDFSADSDGAGAASAGHDFGRVAVSPPMPAPITYREEIRPRQQRFSVNIRRTTETDAGAADTEERPEVTPPTAQLAQSLRSADAGPGSEEQHLDPNAQTAQTPTAGQAPAIPEPAEGETVSFPDIILPLSLVSTDTISGALTFASNIAESADDPGAGNFGLTEAFAPGMSNIKVTATSGAFHVTADLNSDITVKVRATTGPDGQTDIDGDADTDITSANYGQVVSDLTPNAHDLSGRPPRTKFWAHDITVKHERFHATDDDKFFKQGTTQSQTWLNAQTADSAAAVNALLNQVPNKIISVVAANMAPPDSEKRAYADGSASYQARADAIKTKGDAHKYPAPAAP